VHGSSIARFWHSIDHIKQTFSQQWNVRFLVQFMCHIEQISNYQYGINAAAPPASQNLVKGGSPKKRNNELVQNNDGLVAEAPRFLCGGQIRRAKDRDM
jgi:hypothetical protein